MFRLNSASLTFGSTDEGNQFRRKQKLTRSKFSFWCTLENPMPKHRWDTYLRHVKAMVVDHFIRSIRHQSKNLSKHYELLFTGSEAPAGPTELSKVQRDKQKLGTMCHALIVEHMFTSNLDTYTGDDAIIDTFTREDSARATRARASTADKLAFDRKKAEWKRHLAPFVLRSAKSSSSSSGKSVLLKFSKILNRFSILTSCRIKQELVKQTLSMVIFSYITLKTTMSLTTRIPSQLWNGSPRRWFVGNPKRSLS